MSTSMNTAAARQRMGVRGHSGDNGRASSGRCHEVPTGRHASARALPNRAAAPPRIVHAEWVPGEAPRPMVPVPVGSWGYIVPPARLAPSGDGRYLVRLTVVRIRAWDRVLGTLFAAYAIWKVRP